VLFYGTGAAGVHPIFGPGPVGARAVRAGKGVAAGVGAAGRDGSVTVVGGRVQVIGILPESSGVDPR
jgi:hypothetical protein